MAGIRGVLVDLDEVDAALGQLPASKVRGGFGSYGPKARVIDIPVQPIIVNDRLGSDR
jgi:hypothetical protein